MEGLPVCLPIRQVAMKSFLPDVKIYLSRKAGRDFCRALQVRAIMRRWNGRPGTTTLHAKCKEPMSHWRSWRWQQVLACQEETRERSLVSLSSGSLASIVEESRRIPINSNWRARWKKGVSDDLRLKSKLLLFSWTLAHRLVFMWGTPLRTYFLTWDLKFEELAYYFCVKSVVELNSLKWCVKDFFCSLPELKQRNQPRIRGPVVFFVSVLSKSNTLILQILDPRSRNKCTTAFLTWKPACVPMFS